VVLRAWLPDPDPPATVTDAEQGDVRTREWLSRYVTGGIPNGSTSLAAYEAAGGVDHLIEKEAKDMKERAEHIDYFDLGGWMRKYGHRPATRPATSGRRSAIRRGWPLAARSADGSTAAEPAARLKADPRSRTDRHRRKPTAPRPATPRRGVVI
jgi:hypothetical protein